MSWIETKREAGGTGLANAASSKVEDCRTLMLEGRIGHKSSMMATLEQP